VQFLCAGLQLWLCAGLQAATLLDDKFCASAFEMAAAGTRLVVPRRGLQLVA
jgi:hypothetical protein